MRQGRKSANTPEARFVNATLNRSWEAAIECCHSVSAASEKRKVCTSCFSGVLAGLAGMAEGLGARVGGAGPRGICGVAILGGSGRGPLGC